MKTNSNVNQTIKGKFVGNEIKSNVNSMVEYILKQDDYQNAPFSWEDVENLTTDNSEEIEKLQEELEEVETQCEELKEIGEDTPELESAFDKKKEIEDKIEELENEQEEQQEVYEWWIVSDFLCRKLKEQGEVVIESENIWGRCCTGQAILLDGVISNICEEMEILDGQKYSWTDK